MSEQGVPPKVPASDVVQKFQKMMMEFQGLKLEYHNLENLSNMSISHCKDLSDKLDDISKKHIALTRLISESLDTQKSINDNHKAAIFGLGVRDTNFSQFIDDLKIMYQNIDQDVRKIQSHLGSLVSLNDLKPYIERIDSALFAADRNEKELASHRLNIADNLDKVKENLNKHEDELSRLKPIVSRAIECQIVHEGKFSTLRDEAKNDVAKVRSDFEDKLANAIKSIPMPQGLKIEDVKQEIVKSHEATRLDASNANLRSANTESKMAIFERKLEQLQLQIKQLQLKE